MYKYSYFYKSFGLPGIDSKTSFVVLRCYTVLTGIHVCVEYFLKMTHWITFLYSHWSSTMLSCYFTNWNVLIFVHFDRVSFSCAKYFLLIFPFFHGTLINLPKPKFVKPRVRYSKYLSGWYLFTFWLCKMYLGSLLCTRLGYTNNIITGRLTAMLSTTLCDGFCIFHYVFSWLLLKNKHFEKQTSATLNEKCSAGSWWVWSIIDKIKNCWNSVNGYCVFQAWRENVVFLT